MKILITGAAGYLGSHLVSELANRNSCEIIAVDTRKDAIPKVENIRYLSNDELFHLDSLSVDTVINCAFARGNNSSDLVSALNYTEDFILKLKEFFWGGMVNISSQGLYKSMNAGEFASEDSTIEPGEMYSLAKYAQEKLLTSNFPGKITNIRMSSLAGNARFLVYFVERAITEKPITVTTPSQIVSIMDVRDAVSGILKICDLRPEQRRPVYNLGSGKQYSILEIAQFVKEIGVKKGYPELEITVEENDKCCATGVNFDRLIQDTGWKPEHEIHSMIGLLFDTRSQV